VPDWHTIRQQLAAEYDLGVSSSTTPRPVGGGDINAAWRLQTGSGDVFFKTSRASAIDMFSAEAEGLRQLREAGAVRVPKVYGSGVTEHDAWIAMEWLKLRSAGIADDELLGRQLAALHRVTAEKHGWHRDNTIGLTHQPNGPRANWPQFFRERRLQHQLRLAAENGYDGELQAEGQHLVDNMERFFADYEPVASLLHGDLWSGNRAVADEQPVIFDPAVYFGDRETDLAMTGLFGGFHREFYIAYRESWPLEPGNEQRCRLYQLYHVLNHLNLFGGGYLGQALRLMRSLR
jgi:fructosamine-3-kinase